VEPRGWRHQLQVETLSNAVHIVEPALERLLSLLETDSAGLANAMEMVSETVPSQRMASDLMDMKYLPC
jgi:hypothetical protein